MSSKVGVWKWDGASPDSQYGKEGSLSFFGYNSSTGYNNLYTPWFSRITRVFLAGLDKDGVQQSEFLKNILVGQKLTFRALSNIKDAHWLDPIQEEWLIHDMVVEVSGAPILESRAPGLLQGYSIPVSPVSLSPSSVSDSAEQGLFEWLIKPCQSNYNPIGCYTTVFGITDFSKNTVTMPDTVLTTWDASTFASRNDRWDTREGEVRKKIYKMTQAKNNISFIYKESLRSMITSFNDIGYIDSEEKFNSIMCIHANAERAMPS